MSLLQRAIDYVRENKDWSVEQEQDALMCMDEQRVPLSIASPTIVDSIHDLMEEFSDNEELPEEWWYEETDEESIFMQL